MKPFHSLDRNAFLCDRAQRSQHLNSLVLSQLGFVEFTYLEHVVRTCGKLYSIFDSLPVVGRIASSLHSKPLLWDSIGPVLTGPVLTGRRAPCSHPSKKTNKHWKHTEDRLTKYIRYFVNSTSVSDALTLSWLLLRYHRHVLSCVFVQESVNLTYVHCMKHSRNGYRQEKGT